MVITSNSILSVVALNLWLYELSYTTLVLGFSFEQFQFTDNILIITFMLLITLEIVSVY